MKNILCEINESVPGKLTLDVVEEYETYVEYQYMWIESENPSETRKFNYIKQLENGDRFYLEQ